MAWKTAAGPITRKQAIKLIRELRASSYGYDSRLKKTKPPSDYPLRKYVIQEKKREWRKGKSKRR